MSHSTTTAVLTRIFRAFPAVILVSVLLYFGACDDDTASPDAVISVRITQPLDSAVVQDTVLRVLTEISKDCGCQAYVEFHIDGVHVYSDYLAFYSFDWDIRNITGMHVIAAHVVVPNRGDAWDSVRVTINP